MVNAEANRSQIDAVINNYGSTITVYVNTPTFDVWGKKTDSFDAGTSTKGVPDNLLTFERKNSGAGVLNNASTIIIVKGQESISKNDRITYDGKNYFVINVQEFALADVILAKQVALEETNLVVVTPENPIIVIGDNEFPMNFTFAFSIDPEM